jgi:hypothetical protein
MHYGAVSAFILRTTRTTAGVPTEKFVCLVPGELVRRRGLTQCHIVTPQQNNNSPACPYQKLDLLCGISRKVISEIQVSLGLCEIG